MADIRILQDVDTGEDFYPATHEEAIVDDNGYKVIEKLKSELKSDLSKETTNRNSAISKAVNEEKNRAITRENEIEELFTMPTQEAVNKWLDEHPEATTTVQDHSLTIDKMVIGTLGYVTPEMFGAVGDGVVDDTEALQQALNTRLPLKGKNGKKYYTTTNLKAYNDISDVSFIFETSKMLIFSEVEDVTIKNNYFEMLGRITDPDDRGEYAISFNYSTNIKIIGNHFYHFTSNIICNVSANIFIENNYFYDSFQNATKGNGYGIVLQCCKSVTINNNIFKDVQRHSVYISYSDAYESDDRFNGFNRWCDNVIVSNNIFELTDYNNDGYNRTSTEQQVKCYASKNVTIEGNQFLGTYGALFISTEVEDNNGYCENIIFNNNIIKNQVSEVRAIILELWQGVNSPINKNIMISGNVFQNTSKNPCIKLSKVNGLIISNNISSEINEYEANFDYLCAFFHEELCDDKNLECYRNIKITNNHVTNRGLVKLYSEYGEYGLGLISDIEISNNTVMYSSYTIMSYIANTTLNNLRILNNIIKESNSSSIFLNSADNFEGDNIFVIGNDLSGTQVIFDETFTGKIYFLKNTNSRPNPLPSTSVNDVYAVEIVATAEFNIPKELPVGNNELEISFPKELRNVPQSVLFVFYSTKNVPSYFGTLSLKGGSMTKTGFTVVVPKLQETTSTWSVRYVAVGIR